MKKVIRLTESDLQHIIKESVKKVLKEYTGDAEEFGMYDLYKDFYDMPEEEYQNLQRQRSQQASDDEDDMTDYAYWDEADRALMTGHMDNAYDPGGYL